MFAVIRTGGKQYRVQEGDILDVEKLPAEPNEKFHFNQVLLIADEKDTLVGTPLIERALVRAEILENFKDKKVIVFKKKRRKQYRRMRGHRQPLTRVKIEKIIPDVTALGPEEMAAIEKKLAPEIIPAAEKAAPAVPVEEKVKAPKEKKVVRPAKPAATRPPAREKKARPAAKEKKPVAAKKPKGKKIG